MSERRDKWVRRFTVDETAKHKNGFTIYKITSVLFPIESPEAVTVVSVWKRYSDVQRLHKSMRALHAGLHLRGTFPALARHSYFKRFQKEVVAERATTVKSLLEFVAEHRLLFTSTDFVNFLQTGYPEPEQATGIINAIRSSLHLPIEETPPLEYQTDDDDSRSPIHTARSQTTDNQPSIDVTDFISQITIYEAADVEIRQSPTDHKLSSANSFESLNSLDSINSDLYDELSKVTIDKHKPSVKSKSVLPDLINFDAPSTSKFEDYHTMSKSSNNNSDTTSLTSIAYGSSSSVYDIERRSSSRVSLYSKQSVLSMSNVESKTTTEDSYVFEAGYMLNLAARCDDMGDYQRAFECYKSGIEKMLIGVQSDPDPQRRTLIKEKTNKYLSYAEAIYKNHLCGIEQSNRFESLKDCVDVDDLNDRLVENIRTVGSKFFKSRRQQTKKLSDHTLKLMAQRREIKLQLSSDASQYRQLNRQISKSLTSDLRHYNTQVTKSGLVVVPEPGLKQLLSERECTTARPLHCPIPKSMLKRPYEDLSLYRVLAVLSSSIMLVLHKEEQSCYAMKVIQKVPHNLTEFDEYFLQRTNETREPILPTVIPYMVPLHAFIETNNLIFLILGYAPGEKLFDYIKNYAKSTPNTPAREVNLENVFTEPKSKKIDLENDNIEFIDSINDDGTEAAETIVNNNQSIDAKTDALDNVDVSELVFNSQKLLLNVDKVLSETKAGVEKDGGARKDDGEKIDVGTPVLNKVGPPKRRARGAGALPGAAPCRWGAELLTALESLHNCGVVCRDLNPSNILLGDRGQIILTYMVSYPGSDMALAKIRASRGVNMHIAPELYEGVYGERDGALDRVCDYWSFGVVMYELLCGVPLSSYHRGMFTSHTVLQLPDGLPVEVESLLTQLLTYEPSERLGSGKDGIDEIKQHPYFKNIDWRHVYDAWALPG